MVPCSLCAIGVPELRVIGALVTLRIRWLYSNTARANLYVRSCRHEGWSAFGLRRAQRFPGVSRAVMLTAIQRGGLLGVVFFGGVRLLSALVVIMMDLRCFLDWVVVWFGHI